MTLMMNEEGHFRIAQVTDVHLNDYPLSENDQAILRDLQAGLEALQPDLIMITGDFVNSYQNNQEEAIVRTFFDFLNRFQVPKAVTFGNHDSEHQVSRQDLEHLFEEIVDYRVDRHYESTVDGMTQYVVEIVNQDQSLNRVLYVLDSGQVAPGDDKTNDWILPEQVDWFRQTAPHYQSCHDNLVFIHIPLPEYLRAKTNIVSGELREPKQLISTSRINTGLFSELFFSQQIHGVFCGHNHLNNAEMIWEDIHLYYGLFSGKETKAGDFRGLRYIDLSNQPNQTSVTSACLFYKDLI